MKHICRFLHFHSTEMFHECDTFSKIILFQVLATCKKYNTWRLFCGRGPYICRTSMFGLIRRCTAPSAFDINVPRERFKTIRSSLLSRCFGVISRSVCTAPHDSLYSRVPVETRISFDNKSRQSCDFNNNGRILRDPPYMSFCPVALITLLKSVR